MQQLNVECVDGIHKETVYSIRELSLLRHNLECKESKKHGVKYLEIPAAFDIETTNIYRKDESGNIDLDFRPFSFMYHWQFCINDEVCFGRTWAEFRDLLDNLTRRMDLDNKRRLVIWCHNLAFEFQHFRRFVRVIDGFYKEERMPLKVVIEGGIEFRDSYILSNMTLEKFCENEPGVTHFKLSGNDYNYDLIRTPSYIMSPQEQAYCYNDVRGLVECIRSRMKEDTLGSMPMTSTGYIRRDARIAVKKNPKNRAIFTASALTPELYIMCRQAFRGGNTHANVRHANQLIHDIDSYDIQSSYPYIMLCKRFPISPFFRIKTSTFFEYDLSEYALLITCRFTNIKHKAKHGIPYIPIAKCSGITADKRIDNGRVLYAAVCEMTITDIDFDIIIQDYDFDDLYIKEVYASRYGYLSEEYRNVVLKYYTGKTELKGVHGKEYEYVKEKNKCNGTYGMMCQRIDHSKTTYDGNDYIVEECNLKESLEKYYKSYNSFLSYQYGVWVTAHARMHLQKMLWKIGKDVCYVDTDSIKCINDHHEEFEEANKEIIKEAEAAGAVACDRDGIPQYMGIWDWETRPEKGGKYQSFKTLGSKKYLYQQGDHVISTIAGVNKETGSKFFKEHGFDAFEIGTRLKNSGHLTAFYNDDDIHTIVIDGEEIETGSNVAIVDNTYTLGVTGDYFDLLQKALEKEDDLYYI